MISRVDLNSSPGGPGGNRKDVVAIDEDQAQADGEEEEVEGQEGLKTFQPTALFGVTPLRSHTTGHEDHEIQNLKERYRQEARCQPPPLLMRRTRPARAQ